MFKKAKPTFLSQAGRQGAPMSRKPFAKKVTKASAGKIAAGNGKNTVKATKKVVKNGAPLKTGAVKGAMNSYRMSKATGMTKQGAADMMKNMFGMNPKYQLKSATGSPQTAPQAFKPRG